jgi:hypothetical protein
MYPLQGSTNALVTIVCRLEQYSKPYNKASIEKADKVGRVKPKPHKMIGFSLCVLE